jgi:multidrug resistance efflux pump
LTRRLAVRRAVVIAATVVVLAGCAAALGFFWPFGHREQVLRLPGLVEIQEVRLASKVGGRVEKVMVLEGEHVSPGQELVRFEVPELQAQREQAKARLDAAVADWEKAKNGPRPEEKKAAKAAAEAAKAKYERMQAGWREEEKRQAKSDQDAADAELKQALEDFDRTAELYRSRSIARAEYDSALGARDRARGRANSARAKYDMLKHGNRPEDKESSRAEWQQAQAQYELLEAGTRAEEKAAARAKVDELRARLEELDVNLAEKVVRASEHAIVEVLSVRKGDVVAANQPVVRVLRAEDLWVKVFVPETELGKVRLNQDVEVLIDSYPDRRFKGQVIQVASISEFTPRNVQSVDERRHQVFAVKVRVPDPQGVFKSGMAAEVILPLQGAP